FLFTYQFASTVVMAPAGEQLSYALPDGSRVLLNSGTSIVYKASFGRSARRLHMQGEAFFNVEKSDIPFYVHTADAIVHVTGTSFQVRSWMEDATTSIMVERGSVNFYSKESPDSIVRLTPGETSSLTKEMRTPSSPTPFNPQVDFAWQQNQFAYQNTPVRAIFRDLERRFNIQIAVEESEALNSTLSTFYSGPVELETLMQDICTVKGLSYSKTANGFRVYSP
ncbi:MAG: FecR family protein, partial [Balneolales bacterium]|nr:FecR family protein [Balneolales bacterium]